MKNRVLQALLLSLALLAGVNRATAFDGVVIANESVSTASLTADALKDIFTGKTMYWEGGAAIVIIYVGDKTDAQLKEACGMEGSAFKTFWQRLAFSGRAKAPKRSDTVAAAVSEVASTKGAIAIVTADAKLEGVKKIEIK
jgi:ABC-type phosphate transport system substrate-binding protein